MQRLQTFIPGHLSSHSALSSYGLFAPLALWRLSVSLRPLVQAPGSFPASGAPWSSTMLLSLGRGRAIINNNRLRVGRTRFIKKCGKLLYGRRIEDEKRIYRKRVMSTIMYGCETWWLKNRTAILRTERTMCNGMLTDKRNSQELINTPSLKEPVDKLAQEIKSVTVWGCSGVR